MNSSLLLLHRNLVMITLTTDQKRVRRIIFRYIFPSLGALAAISTIIVNYPKIVIILNQMKAPSSIQQVRYLSISPTPLLHQTQSYLQDIVHVDIESLPTTLDKAPHPESTLRDRR